MPARLHPQHKPRAYLAIPLCHHPDLIRHMLLGQTTEERRMCLSAAVAAHLCQLLHSGIRELSKDGALAQQWYAGGGGCRLVFAQQVAVACLQATPGTSKRMS